LFGRERKKEREREGGREGEKERERETEIRERRDKACTEGRKRSYDRNMREKLLVSFLRCFASPFMHEPKGKRGREIPEEHVAIAMRLKPERNFFAIPVRKSVVLIYGRHGFR